MKLDKVINYFTEKVKSASFDVDYNKKTMMSCLEFINMPSSSDYGKSHYKVQYQVAELRRERALVVWENLVKYLNLAKALNRKRN